MLTDDDKKWIAAEISTQIAASEKRMGARMEKVEAALSAEFRKWVDGGAVASKDFMQGVEKLRVQDREQ